MNIADDLVSAFNDGYERGKADAEAYLLHCGDTDEPQTNGDRIRAMSDEELAQYIIVMAKDDYCDRKNCTGRPCWQCRLEWLKKEVDENDKSES